MFAAMNLLAFASQAVRDCLEQIWIDAGTAERARKRCFEHIRTHRDLRGLMIRGALDGDVFVQEQDSHVAGTLSSSRY